MPSFQTAFTPKKRYKFALVMTASTPNVGNKPQILQVLEKYMNRQRNLAKHDLRVNNRAGKYRLVRLKNNQQLTDVPVMF